MNAESKASLVEEFRRDSILSATAKVIARNGLSGATMQQIADEARIAKGTIYLYFDSREELMEKAADRAFSQLLDRSEHALASGRALAERLREMVRAQYEFFDENQQFLRVYMLMRYGDDCAAEARRRRSSRPQYQRYMRLLADFLAEGMRRGDVKPADPNRLAAFLAEGLSAVFMRRLEGEQAPAEQEGDWIVDLILNGIAVRGASAGSVS